MVPPANALSSVLTCQSSKPLKVHPDAVALPILVGAVPIHVGEKLFQSKLMGAAGARLPSSPSKPALVPTVPALLKVAGPTSPSTTAAVAPMMTLLRILICCSVTARANGGGGGLAVRNAVDERHSWWRVVSHVCLMTDSSDLEFCYELWKTFR